MKRINVKKLLLSVLGLTMVAVLTVAGTYAYLQSETPEVVNTFKANGVTVTLTETTGETYDIIPGTTVSKDPTVTVENTLDAFVFAEITDATNGLVDYEIADGWEVLKREETPKQVVLYREVAADAAEADKTFHVLKNDQVTYSADLTNEDMLKSDGKTLKEGITLTFKASAVQKSPFETAENAWKLVPAEAGTRNEFMHALADGKTEIVLNDSVDIGSITVPTISEDTVIDLNGHTFTAADYKKALQVQEHATVTVKGGTITGNPTKSGAVVGAKDNAKLIVEDCTIKLNSSSSTSVSAIEATSAAQVTLKNTTIEVTASTSSSALYADGGSTITAENCTITMKGNQTFAVTTNGSVSQNATIVVKNSTISAPTAAGKKGYALYAPAGTIIFEKCNVTGHILIAGGNATLDGGTYTATGFNNQSKIWNKTDTIDYVSKSAGGGAFNMGDSILIADRRNGYDLSSVTVKNITFNTTIPAGNAYAIKYVDMMQGTDETRANIVIENNTYNNQIDGADPVMYIDLEGNDITFTPAP